MSTDTGRLTTSSSADSSAAARRGVGPAAEQAADLPSWACERSPLGTFPECPMCGGAMAPEHAHERCTACGWRDSCCD
jgi:hypothetical protein